MFALTTTYSRFYSQLFFCCLFSLLTFFAYGQKDVVDETGKKMTVDDFLAASEKKKQAGDYKEASRFMNEAATWHWERKEYEKAVQYFEQSIKLNEVIDNQQGIIGIKNNLGMIHADLRQYEKAYQYFALVLEERKKAKEPVSIIASLINISVITNNLQRYDQSIAYIQESLNLAIQMKDIEQMRSCYGMLAETYEKKGDPVNTLKYFNLYRTFHEESQRTKLEKVQMTAQEAELHAKLLELENRNKALSLNQKDAVIGEQEKELAGLTAEQQTLLATMSKKDMLLLMANNELKVKELQFKEQEAREELEDVRQFWLIAVLVICLVATVLIVVILARSNAEKRKTNWLLTQQKHQLQEQTEALHLQAEELQTQAESILAKNDKLDKLNSVKDKMLSIIAHDVRSPLSMIAGFLDLFESGDLNKAEQQELSSQLKVSTLHTLDMLEDLLNWARSQMGGIKTQPTLFNLTELAQEKTNFLGELAQKKQVEIINSLDKEYLVWADKNQISIVFQNLLSNAIKFTNPQGYVTILLLDEPTNYFTVQVSDTGVGIGADKIDQLFKTDSHFTTKGTANEKGTGLGLLLCKEFIEKNGGTIWVKSELYKGSTFSFKLPLSAIC